MSWKVSAFVRKVAAFPFVLYKIFISPLLPAACLYRPTCSEYFREAILKFGIIKGMALGFARLMRCNGWFFEGGDDPLPEIFSWNAVTVPYRVFRTRRLRR